MTKLIGTTNGKEVYFVDGTIIVRYTNIAIYNVKEEDAIEICKKNFNNFKEI